MDAKSRLVAYLEQRRELGESEFYLDQMSVDDALIALGAIKMVRPAASVRPVITNQQVGVSTGSLPTAPIVETKAISAAPIAVKDGDVAEKSRSVEHEHAKKAITPTTTPVQVITSAAAITPVPVVAGMSVGSDNTDIFDVKEFAHLKSIGAIAKEVDVCTRCELYKTATNAVPGEGNLKADLICVGEAPGANEDATGRPFVGAAGKLMDKILAAINLTREDVFICNVLKHRPPGNRNPLPNEVKACSPYLVRQIEIIKPKVIVAWGTFAAQTLLETKTPIGKLRGTVHKYHGVPLVVTYHPAALLRNPAWKRPTWEDVQLARRVLDSAK